MTGLYDHGLLSDHRYQAARRTCERSGDPLEVSGGANITGLLASLLFLAIGGFVFGAVLYFLLWVGSWLAGAL